MLGKNLILWNFLDSSKSVNRRDGKMALGEGGIDLVRPVKYSLKPLHHLQKVQKAKLQKTMGKKSKMQESWKIWAWGGGWVRPSIIWGSPGQLEGSMATCWYFWWSIRYFVSFLEISSLMESFEWFCFLNNNFFGFGCKERPQYCWSKKYCLA